MIDIELITIEDKYFLDFEDIVDKAHDIARKTYKHYELELKIKHRTEHEIGMTYKFIVRELI